MKQFDDAKIEHVNETSNIFSELDKKITIEEIKTAISKLKRCKSSGIDTIMNEYFIKCQDILIEPLEMLFNVLIESGIYPSQWTKGVVIPIFKKGAKDDVNNYRGITLVSCFGKLFSTILNERLKVWSIENDISSDAQFGFKQDHSTIDTIFILQNLVNDHLSRGKQLYCAFIDFRKAFDSVYRNGVWYKLIKSGVDWENAKTL